jgi:hypothetical protein
MKIAVCLSGQPRTIKYTYKNILDHFSNYDVDYFCQSWDFNTYKYNIPGVHVAWSSEEDVDHHELISNLNLYNPKKYIIQKKGAEPLPVGWGSLFYSTTVANFLKKQYEIENNFRYDAVVKSRYDIVFNPNEKFVVDPRVTNNNYLDILVSWKGRMSFEYDRVNVMDTFYYGSSTAMDIMTNLYSLTTLKSQDTRSDDNEEIGPGVRMSDLAESKNMQIIYTRKYMECVYRKDAIPLDPQTDFFEIEKIHKKYYT